jgi:hypothetical protein
MRYVGQALLDGLRNGDSDCRGERVDADRIERVLFSRARVEQVTTCTSDCNIDDKVTVEELVRAVNIALGERPVGHCVSLDMNDDEAVTVDELIAAVDSALEGCDCPEEDCTPQL